MSCVTRAVLIGSGSHPAAQPHTATLAPQGEPTQLRGDHGLRIWIRSSYAVEQADESRSRWTARTVGYRYHLLDANGRELCAYHWHPGEGNLITFPHVQIAGQIVPLDRKVHLPTGYIALKSIVRCAITDLGVRPLRPDWSEVLKVDEGVHA